MASNRYGRIVALVRRAAALAKKAGIGNLLQPGLVKEMILADLLSHELISSKRHADACDSKDPSRLYEYLTCKEGGTWQLDRMFKSPAGKRAESLRRISRNHRIYFAMFYKNDQLALKVVYELEVEPVLRETERQLDRSSNAISHVGFSEGWVKQRASVVFEDSKA